MTRKSKLKLIVWTTSPTMSRWWWWRWRCQALLTLESHKDLSTGIGGCKHPSVAILQLKTVKTHSIRVLYLKKIATYE